MNENKRFLAELFEPSVLTPFLSAKAPSDHSVARGLLFTGCSVSGLDPNSSGVTNRISDRQWFSLGYDSAVRRVCWFSPISI